MNKALSNYLAIAGLSVVIPLAAGPGQARVVPDGHPPVLVELFTSEGCSSCPPADLLLMELDREGRAADARVVVLSEHVDYWNRIGWVDPFASSRFTDRQRAYAARFREAGIYTPQMVVDGRVGFVGSDREHALRAIRDAERQPKAKVILALDADHQGPSGNQVRISILLERHPGSGAAAPADVFLAVTENALHSQVLRGENAGRRLDHAGVVRRLMDLGHTDPTTGGFTAMPEVPLEPGWNREHLRVVVFAQEAGCGPVLGSAALSLAGPGPGTKNPKTPL